MDVNKKADLQESSTRRIVLTDEDGTPVCGEVVYPPVVIERADPGLPKAMEGFITAGIRMKNAWVGLGRQIVASLSLVSAAVREASKQIRLYALNEPYIKPPRRPTKLRKRRKTQYSRHLPY